MEQARFRDNIMKQFNKPVVLRDAAPGIVQLIAPFFHPDGDLIEVYFSHVKNREDIVRITDCGMTLMRISYTEDSSKPSVISFINNALSEQRVGYDEGEIFLDSPLESVQQFTNYFITSITKVMGVTALNRKSRKSVFYEEFDDFVMSELKIFGPVKNFTPIPKSDEFTVDYMFPSRKSDPVFLFPIRNENRLKDALATILFFRNENISFFSLSVCEDIDAFSRKDKKKIINIPDKIIDGAEEFYGLAASYLTKLLLAK